MWETILARARHRLRPCGGLVLIDMLNSHHPEFNRIDPKSAADGNRLLLARLRGWRNEYSAICRTW